MTVLDVPRAGGAWGSGRLVRWVRIVALVVATLTLQLAVVSDLPGWGGAVGELMLLLAVAAASIASDPNRGALAGFAVGLTYDLMLGTPLGLSALVYALVGYGVATVNGWLSEPPAWVHLLVAPVAGALAVVTTVVVAMTLGFFYPWTDVAQVIVVVAIWNTVLILPVRRLMQWAVRTDDSDTYWMAIPGRSR